MFYNLALCVLVFTAVVSTGHIAPVAFSADEINISVQNQASVQTAMKGIKGKWQGFINRKGGQRDQLNKFT